MSPIIVNGADPQLNTIDTVVDRIEADTTAIETKVDTVDTVVDAIALYAEKVFATAPTLAANAGDQTLATVTGNVLIESITIKMITFHADLTSIAVAGGASKAYEFISAATGASANLGAEDEQVAWTGAVDLGATKTIVATMAGTGANNVSFRAIIKYRQITAGSSLA